MLAFVCLALFQVFATVSLGWEGSEWISVRDAPVADAAVRFGARGLFGIVCSILLYQFTFSRPFCFLELREQAI